MQRGAKVACYGREGTGKTELVMSARHVGKLILLDTEGRSQYYDPDVGFGFEVKYSKSAEDALELLAYAESLHASGERVVLGIDSFSSIWQEQQEVAEKKGATSFGTPKFSSWAVAKKPLKRLYNAIFTTPIDVIVTMRAKPKYEQKSNSTVKDFGHDVPETERGMGYTVDLIVEMGHSEVKPGVEIKPEDYYAIVTKSSGEKDNAMPIGTVIRDPSFNKLLGLRLEGMSGGMEFDEDVLLQVGMTVSSPGEFKRWVETLRLDANQVVDQLKEEFGELKTGDMSPYVKWVWDLHESLKK